MSYVLAAPELVAEVAGNLAGIGSAINGANAAAAASTMQLLPAASDTLTSNRNIKNWPDCPTSGAERPYRLNMSRHSVDAWTQAFSTRRSYWPAALLRCITASPGVGWQTRTSCICSSIGTERSALSHKSLSALVLHHHSRINPL